MATQPRTRSGTGRAEPRDPYAAEGRLRPSQDVGEALERARRHGRAAAAESLGMLHALLEAASLSTTGRSSEASLLLSPLAKLLEGLGDDLAIGLGDQTSRILATISSAIDDEISLWEKRARDDTEARTVLRAFLGLREVLWEFGVRNGGSPGTPRPQRSRSGTDAPRQRKAAAQQGPRVQRVPVQG